MKKFSFAALIIILGMALAGCDAIGPSDTTTTTRAVTTTTAVSSTTSTSTSGTTTTTNPLVTSAGQNAGQSAMVGVNMILGISNVGSAVGDICGISGDPSQIFGSSVNALATIPVPPPASFFTPQDGSWDGFLNVASLHTGETVALKFSTFSGEAIDGSIFAGKQIATIEGINWDDLVNVDGISADAWAPGITWWMTHGTPYETINSMWDYILWSSVLNKVHTIAAIRFPPTPVFAIPTSEVYGDMIGSFYGTVTREASTSNYGVNLIFVGSMEYNTSITPHHEVPKSLTGEGTVTLPSGTVINLSDIDMLFETNIHGGVVPSTGTFIWSFTASGETWSGLTYISSDRTGSGEVRRDGTVVGTLYLDAIGGAVVTIEGVTIPVTQPQ